MIVNLLGDCVKTADQIGITEPVVEEFSHTVHVPVDYDEHTLPIGVVFGFVDYHWIVSGRWIVTFEVTSGGFTVDYAGDDFALAALGFSPLIEPRIDDYLVGFELTVPGESGNLFTFSEVNPYKMDISPDGPKSIDISYPLLSPVVRCFPEESSLFNMQVLLANYVLPVVFNGVNYVPQDYGWPSDITIEINGELIERAT